MDVPSLTSPVTYLSRADDSRQCDLIMKGGISSGIIYPRAACTLAATYRFRSVGGASAGAIAAAAVAAAEHGRKTGGFVRLFALPDDLGTSLAGLFQPGPTTKRPFSILSAWLEPKLSVAAKLKATAIAVAADAPVVFALVLAGLLVVPLAAIALTGGAGLQHWLGWAIAALVWIPTATILALAAAGYVLAKRTLTAMTGNGFGLCNGHQRDPSTDAAPLTDWMTATFDNLAGKAPGEPPLTFGDLWGEAATALQRPITDRDDQDLPVDPTQRAAAAAARDVDLVVMTTCLTFQRPYRFPFTDSTFFFCPEHLGEYFPQQVVTHMLATTSAVADRSDTVDGAEQPISMRCPTHHSQVHHLPHPWDIPVVVAARLSLSFPGLISAVPLFTVDDSRKPGSRTLIPVWFSDGGISSNFPMHFFDSPFPGRPTFGIDLGPLDPDYPDELVYKPPRQGGTGQPSATPLPGMLAFGHAILNTMQDWVDNTQITMPGFRDRIVTVRQRPGEGGMNLKMPASTISSLADRGAEAARKFSDFDLHLHQWIRYRVAMSGNDEMLTSLNAKYVNGFQDFIGTYGPITDHFKIGGPAATTADASATQALMSLAGRWVTDEHPSSAGELPAPKPDIRFVPRQ
ncbi:MAG: hypothetical protein ABI890_02290 [Lapillicoccus sp.]